MAIPERRRLPELARVFLRLGVPACRSRGALGLAQRDAASRRGDSGQLTPRPVFSTATFIGYVLGGLPGAFLSTVGSFLPAFVFVALSGPLVPRIRRSPVAGAFPDGVNVASRVVGALLRLG